ncbi:MAG: DUF465 domain-containing protein [Candidatus Thiodiazotropha taylori]|uniref:DUF465 domain-containing protein n=1 Tax=Candidatus Thiodiazotropha taylori TaxID=2792791 RepID=A0A9E4K9E9_9GAMM|nr:DUF465 domain-containing protein [Candidatus Thiodiazotropha taylori]MCW4254942.1 DUF465 domain-containing protein [Candidatus Thiodiazotropha taylori]
MNVKSLKNHIKRLKAHKELIKDTLRARLDLGTDFELEMLKKQKLHIKDEIEKCKRQLVKLKKEQ